MNNLLQDCLSSIDCGNICTLFTHDPLRILSEIELGATRAEDILFCVCLLDPLPEVQSLLSQAIERLALAAFSIFPTWYDRGLSIDPDSSLAVADQLSMPANAHLWAVPGPSKPWLQRAVHSCLAGRHPLLRKYAKHIQADQLALAIGRQRLCLGLVVDDASPRPENLLGLAKAAEWLARITRSRLVLILPQAVATWPEVQGIAFACLPGQTVVQDPGDNEGTPPPHQQERKYTVWPVPGIPHPASPGEQILAKRLFQDQLLAPLFTLNQYVHTIRQSTYLVDLVWKEGQLIVEVDGYTVHSSRKAFSHDRHRDYELMISGYLVLRLPHDEVTADPSSALDKIRDLVLWKMGRLTEIQTT